MINLTPAEVQSVRDELSRAAIRDALFRYCRGVDRADKELILSAFHPGAREDHGQYHGPVEPFVAALVAKIPETVLGIQHALNNMLIELDGDSARAETYFQATYREKANPDTIAAFGGRYLDCFERRNGAWRIAKRTVVNDWSFRHELPVDAKGTTGYPSSCANRDDLLFQSGTWSMQNAMFSDAK